MKMTTIDTKIVVEDHHQNEDLYLKIFDELEVELARGWTSYGENFTADLAAFEANVFIQFTDDHPLELFHGELKQEIACAIVNNVFSLGQECTVPKRPI